MRRFPHRYVRPFSIAYWSTLLAWLGVYLIG